MRFLLEFVPLAAAVAIVGFVPLIEFPFRRFGFPFLSATIGILSAYPFAHGFVRFFQLYGRKPGTLVLFQGATVFAVVAIALGEALRRERIAWRSLIASLGILSVPMTALATNILEGWGPRPDDLGEVLVWVSTAGYVLGPAALAAVVYFLGVQRADLIERFSKKPPDVTG
ncbi:MAG: hypothetical protein WCC48_17640 [Anaeromyxobacteraceae bacterium]